MKGLHQLVTDPVRPLRPGPHGEVIPFPFRYGRPRLKWYVLNVGNFIRGLQGAGCLGEPFLEGAFRSSAGASKARPFRHGVILQIGENLFAGRMLGDCPPGGLADGFDGLPSAERGGRHAPNKVPVVNSVDSIHVFRRRKIHGGDFRSVRRGPQNPAVAHVRPLNIRGETVRAGYDIPAADFFDRGSQYLPVAHAADGDFRWDGFLVCARQLIGAGQRCVSQPAFRGLLLDGAADQLHPVGLSIPFSASARDQDLPSSGRRLANRGHSPRRRPAAGGRAVVRHQLRVRHDQANLLHRDSHLLRGSLGNLSARPLSDLHFAGQDGHGAVFRDVEPGGQCNGFPATALPRRNLDQCSNEQSRTRDFKEMPPVQTKMVTRLLSQLGPFGFEYLVCAEVFTHRYSPRRLWVGEYFWRPAARPPESSDTHSSGKDFLPILRRSAHR